MKDEVEGEKEAIIRFASFIGDTFTQIVTHLRPEDVEGWRASFTYELERLKQGLDAENTNSRKLEKGE